MNANTQMAALPDASSVTRKPRVMIAGEFSAGKSRLINGLLGKEVLPSNVTSTALPPIWLVYGAGEPFVVDLEGNITDFSVEEVDVQSTAFCVMSSDAEILKYVDLIDTPGNSDPNIPSVCWERMVDYADGLVWCTSAMQAWKQTEKATCSDLPEDLLERATLMITQADRMPDERSAQKVQRRVARDAGKYFSDVLMGSMLFEEDIDSVREHVLEMAQGLTLRGAEEDRVDAARVTEEIEEVAAFEADEASEEKVVSFQSELEAEVAAVFEELSPKADKFGTEDEFEFDEKPKATTEEEILAAVADASAPKKPKAKTEPSASHIEDAFDELEAELAEIEPSEDDAPDATAAEGDGFDMDMDGLAKEESAFPTADADDEESDFEVDENVEETVASAESEATEDDGALDDDAWSDWGMDEDDASEASAKDDNTSLGLPNGMVADLWSKLSADSDLSDNERYLAVVADLLTEVQTILQSGAEKAPNDGKV